MKNDPPEKAEEELKKLLDKIAKKDREEMEEEEKLHPKPPLTDEEYERLKRLNGDLL